MGTPRQKAMHVAGAKRMQAIARLVEQRLPDGMLFVVMTFTPGEDGSGGYSGYISNADRADMIKALRECADTLEARMDTPGDGLPVEGNA